jgi:hypothetical protein
MERSVEESIGAQLRSCAGNRRRITRRLRELDEEWDLESVLESKASIVTALGVMAGAVVNRRAPSVPVSWAASVVRLAANGLLPVEPLLRRLGLRSSREIEIERMALTIMLGDLDRGPASLAGRRIPDNGIRVVRH